MLITLLRHATAENRSLTIADSERPLTEKGIKQTKQVAHFCNKHELIPEKLYSSPLLRAKQTAELLRQEIPIAPEVDIVDWLAFDTSSELIIAELKKLADQQANDIWLVGHEPDFSLLISALIQSSDDAITLKKASLTRLNIDFDEDEMRTNLLWSLPCKLM